MQRTRTHHHAKPFVFELVILIAVGLLPARAQDFAAGISDPILHGAVQESSRLDSTVVTPTAHGRRRAIVREPAGPPDLEVVVWPSSDAQTFTTGDLSLTIPGGLLTTAETLRATRSTNAPPPIYKGLEAVAAYDIRLGEQHSFATPLTIRMKYDPAALPPGQPAERVLSASCWDPEQSAWVRMPGTVDTATHEIVVTTNHLSLFSWTMVKLGYSSWFKNHFYIVYNQAEVTDPDFLQWYRNPGSPNYVDINIPNYIEDVMAFLIDGYRAIVDTAGFKAPPLPIDVYVGTDLDSFSEKITGIILISLLPQTADQLRMVTAHEVFHRVQNAYYYDIAGMWWHKWWLEATAEYAGQEVAWPTIHEMGRKITHTYLETPLTDAGPAHDQGYSTSHFVKYLVNNGASFRPMFEACADPSWFDAFSFLDGLSTYLMGVHGLDNGLNRQYQRFARYFVFDPDGPMPPITDSLHSEVAAYRSTLSAGSDATVTFDLAGGYTAKLWGVWFSDDLFDTVATHNYTVSVDGTLPARVEVDVYLLKGDQRVAGGGTPIGTLSQSVKSVQVNVQKGDGVYMLAVNVDGTNRQVRIRIDKTEPGLARAVYVRVPVTIATESGFVYSYTAVEAVTESMSFGSISVSAMTDKFISLSAHSQAPDGTIFAISISQLPMTDPANKTYSASGPATGSFVTSFEYSGIWRGSVGGVYGEKFRLVSADWSAGRIDVFGN